MQKTYTLKSIYALSREFFGILSPTTIWYGLNAREHGKVFFLFSYVKIIVKYILLKIHSLFEHRVLKANIDLLIKNDNDVCVKDYIKPLALYLPQYHTIPENEEWWGEGFTEWTNVGKAKPLFSGHYQPHVPHADIGYYDLSHVDVMRKQASIAKKYGLYGFCFYYYHFANGKRLLERPLNNWLAAKDIDLPFCYAWANENWTRAWDGGDKEIIMPQDYDLDNMRKMMGNMLQDFKDNRYIKAGKNDNTPVLLVYRPEIVPDIERIALEWRKMALDAGFDGLYLISMQNFSDLSPLCMGFDAATEFASVKTLPPLFTFKHKRIKDYYYSGTPLTISVYENILRKIRYATSKEFVRYKCCVPGWDNTPRKGVNGWSVIDNTPELFHSMLKECALQTIGDEKLRENGFLFINAWNEWGEGAHLEPDVKDGYAYLEAVSNVMSSKINVLL